MWAVDRLICVCNFQQICNFLIRANLQLRKCKFVFFACKLVKIRECTLGILPKLFTLPMPMQEEQRWMHHLTYLPRSQAVTVASSMVTESGRGFYIVAFAVSRSVRVLLAYLDARNRSSDSYVIAY